MYALQILTVCLLVSCAFAEEKEIPILVQETDIQPDGAYVYKFETGDGTKAEVTGELKTVDNEVVGVAKGLFSYTGDDGNTYSLSYVADENGFQPTGDHLPKPLEIPIAIQRALDYLATAPPPKE